jgi:hypothetical protein
MLALQESWAVLALAGTLATEHWVRRLDGGEVKGTCMCGGSFQLQGRNAMTLCSHHKERMCANVKK